MHLGNMKIWTFIPFRMKRYIYEQNGTSDSTLIYRREYPDKHKRNQNIAILLRCKLNYVLL